MLRCVGPMDEGSASGLGHLSPPLRHSLPPSYTEKHWLCRAEDELRLGASGDQKVCGM